MYHTSASACRDSYLEPVTRTNYYAEPGEGAPASSSGGGYVQPQPTTQSRTLVNSNYHSAPAEASLDTRTYATAANSPYYSAADPAAPSDAQYAVAAPAPTATADAKYELAAPASTATAGARYSVAFPAVAASDAQYAYVNPPPFLNA